MPDGWGDIVDPLRQKSIMSPLVAPGWFLRGELSKTPQHPSDLKLKERTPWSLGGKCVEHSSKEPGALRGTLLLFMLVLKLIYVNLVRSRGGAYPAHLHARY